MTDTRTKKCLACGNVLDGLFYRFQGKSFHSAKKWRWCHTCEVPTDKWEAVAPRAKSKKAKPKVSRYPGVSRNGNAKAPWRARFRRALIGTFATEEAAHAAYEKVVAESKRPILATPL